MQEAIQAETFLSIQACQSAFYTPLLSAGSGHRGAVSFPFFLVRLSLLRSGLGSDLGIYVTGITGETAGKPDGGPNWGQQHLLWYSLCLLPALSASCWCDCLVWSFHSVNVIHLSIDLSKCGYLSGTVSCICCAWSPTIQEGSWLGWLPVDPSRAFCLHATSSTSLSLSALYKFTTRRSPQPPPLIFFLVFQHYPFL